MMPTSMRMAYTAGTNDMCRNASPMMYRNGTLDAVTDAVVATITAVGVVRRAEADNRTA